MDKRQSRSLAVQPEIERKVEELLTQMTLEEKIGQLVLLTPSVFGAFGMTESETVQHLIEGKLTPEQLGQLERNYHKEKIRAGTVGAFGGVEGAELANELQRIAVEESRLGIPLLFGLDVIHGYRTIFPIPLAEACSWEPELMRRTAQVAAREASAAGIHWTYAPMVDIARDPRWGRIAEGAGEDPYLGSVAAAARVKGFQGEDLSAPDGVLACAKHFAAYGDAVGGRDYNTVDLSLQTLHDIHLPPFEAAIEAGAGSIMSAFNDLNGVPCTANRYLLTDVLRERFSFDGFVVSDANSVAELVVHGHAEDRKDASRLALQAGLDMDMSFGEANYGAYLEKLVSEGSILMSELDEAVRRVLRIKFRMGLFENPYRTDEELERQTMMRPDHLELAREAARRSIILLKNERNLLPLGKDKKRIAVIGPLADSASDLLGSWAMTGDKDKVVTILSGIRNTAGQDTEVLYAKGCDVTSPEADFEEACRLARQCDVVIAVVGESWDMSGEAGSRMDLGLPGNQEALLQALHRCGKPVVAVLVNGRPLAIPWLSENLPAIVEAWQLETEGGNAVADVLFGDYNPSGKLVATFPYSVGQVPLTYNTPNTGRPKGPFKFTSKYIDGPADPLYPFGFGLSYTTFRYENLTVSAAEVSATGIIRIEADVVNTGGRAGEEIVQLYVSDPVASRVRPVKELKGFMKIMLQPGEKKRVVFDLEVASLGYHDDTLRFIVEPGTFYVYIGPNSAECLKGEFVVV